MVARPRGNEVVRFLPPYLACVVRHSATMLIKRGRTESSFLTLGMRVARFLFDFFALLDCFVAMVTVSCRLNWTQLLDGCSPNIKPLCSAGAAGSDSPEDRVSTRRGPVQRLAPIRNLCKGGYTAFWGRAVLVPRGLVVVRCSRRVPVAAKSYCI
jgi:hypothetical protein